MQIEHHYSDARGRFLIPAEEGKPLAMLTYTRTSPGTLTMEHTEVSPTLRGQNIGYQLVESAVDFARKEGLRIQPLCPFVRSVLEKEEKFGDVYERG